jgi:hypothetical protein
MVTSFFQARLENEGLLTPGLDEANDHTFGRFVPWQSMVNHSWL